MYQRLEGALGHGAATMLMGHLPPAGWGDVASGRDVADIRLAMATSAEVAEVSTEMRVGFADLRTEMRVGFADLRSEVATSQRQLLFALLFAILASNATLVSLAFAAAKVA